MPKSKCCGASIKTITVCDMCGKVINNMSKWEEKWQKEAPEMDYVKYLKKTLKEQRERVVVELKNINHLIMRMKKIEHF